MMSFFKTITATFYFCFVSYSFSSSLYTLEDRVRDAERIIAIKVHLADHESEVSFKRNFIQYRNEIRKAKEDLAQIIHEKRSRGNIKIDIERKRLLEDLKKLDSTQFKVGTLLYKPVHFLKGEKDQESLPKKIEFEIVNGWVRTNDIGNTRVINAKWAPHISQGNYLLFMDLGDNQSDYLFTLIKFKEKKCFNKMKQQKDLDQWATSISLWNDATTNKKEEVSCSDFDVIYLNPPLKK